MREHPADPFFACAGAYAGGRIVVSAAVGRAKSSLKHEYSSSRSISLVDVLDLVAGLGSELTMTTCSVLLSLFICACLACSNTGQRERTVSGTASRPRHLLDAVASSIPPDFRFSPRKRGGERGAKGLDWSWSAWVLCVRVCVSVCLCVDWWRLGWGCGSVRRTRGPMRALCGSSGSRGRLTARSRVARADR